MAMSGTVYGNTGGLFDYQLQIPWSVTYNTNTMLATVTVSCLIYPTGSGSKTRGSRIEGSTNDNYVKINGVTLFSKAYNGDNAGSYNNPCTIYTSSESKTDDGGAEPHLYTLNGSSKYCYCYGTLVSNYSFTVPIDPITGIASFTVEAKCTGYYDNSNPSMLLWYINNRTVSTAGTPAEVYSKLPYKTNTGWDGTAYIWYKESAGASGWVRKYIYRKDRVATQSDSGWVKK